MHLPPRHCAALPLVAAAGLYLAFRPHPPEPAESPDVAPLVQLPDVIHLRVQAKARIVGEVLDGRRSLLDAAALFRALDRLPPATSVLVIPIPDSPSIPTHTEDEQYCWSVTIWVRSRVMDVQSPSDGNADERAAVAVARLVAEYEAERTRRGTIRLPDPSLLESAEVLIERARAECSKSPRRQP